MLAFKKDDTPKQELNSGNLIWITSTNDILLKVDYLEEFLEDYFKSGVGIPQLNTGNSPRNDFGTILALLDTYSSKDWINLKDCLKLLILANLKDLPEYLMVFLNLPEMVEEIFVSNYKTVKREIALKQDAVNRKRSKLL